MDAARAREILGVSRSDGESQIREAYREKVRQEHPDQSDRPDEEARERFKEVQTARQVLLEGTPADSGPSSGQTARSSHRTQSAQTTQSTRSATADPGESTSTARDPRDHASNSTSRADPHETAAGATNHRRQTSGTGSQRETESQTTDPRGSRNTNSEAKASETTDPRETNRHERASTSATSSTSTPSDQSARQSRRTRAGGSWSNQRSKSSGTRQSQSKGHVGKTRVSLEMVSRGHFLERWTLSSLDRTLLLLAIGISVYTVIAELLFPEGARTTPWGLALIGVWVGLNGYLGHRLLQDEVRRQGVEVEPYVGNRSVVLSPLEGSLLPIIGLLAGVVLAVPVWMGGAFIFSLIGEIINQVAPVNLALGEFYSDVISLDVTMEFLGAFYAPIIVVYSVAKGYLTDGPYSSEAYRRVNED